MSDESGFNPDKASQIVDLLEQLFPDSPANASLHCCAVLLGLCETNDDARAALEFVISQLPEAIE